MVACGSEDTALIVLRGNSGSGKSSVAQAIRKKLGRGWALVEQDYLRRILLREHDVPNGVNIGLISHTVRYALDHGYHVILEGIMHSERYGDMLRTLKSDHAGFTVFYYFDVSFHETIRRHHLRPQSAEFGIDIMEPLYRKYDVLGYPEEQIIPETSTFDETIELITSAIHY